MNEEEVKYVIHPPEGTEFRECILCGYPMIYDGTSDNCIWCEIHKEEMNKLPITTVYNLSPEIIGFFNKHLLSTPISDNIGFFNKHLLSTPISDNVERYVNKKNRIVLLSKKKIRQQDTGKKKEFEQLLIKFESTYERKKIEEAEYKKKIEDTKKEGSCLSNAGSVERYRRLDF